MKERIANLFNNFKAAGKKGAGHIWAGYAHDVLKEEIEKVENPYGWAYRMMKQDIDANSFIWVGKYGDELEIFKGFDQDRYYQWLLEKVWKK